VSIGRLSGVGALWDCVSRVCGGGGGCAGGGVPLGAGPCCPDVGRCLSGVNTNIIIIILDRPTLYKVTNWSTSDCNRSMPPVRSRGKRVHEPTPSPSSTKKKIRLPPRGSGTATTSRGTTAHLHAATYRRPGPTGQKVGTATGNMYLILNPSDKALNAQAATIVERSANALGRKLTGFNKGLHGCLLRVITPLYAQSIYTDVRNELPGAAEDLKEILDVTNWQGG